MKKLVVVRHGNNISEKPRGLSDLGRGQITRLGEEGLKKIVGNDKVLILSSDLLRAKESAGILSQIFGVEFEIHELLSSDYFNDLTEGLLGIVASRKDIADVIIMVTHLEQTKTFPWFFCKVELLGAVSVPDIEIPQGTAWIIDCEKNTITHEK